MKTRILLALTALLSMAAVTGCGAGWLDVSVDPYDTSYTPIGAPVNPYYWNNWNGWGNWNGPLYGPGWTIGGSIGNPPVINRPIIINRPVINKPAQITPPSQPSIGGQRPGLSIPATQIPSATHYSENGQRPALK